MTKKENIGEYPLTKNQDIELDITGITAEGSGVGHYEGVAVFVPNTAPGDLIDCHIIKTKKTYAIGKINSILKASQHRIIPDCIAFSRCGGCDFRHMSYDEEKRIKTDRIVDAFARIAHLQIEPQEIITGETLRYRNKAQYPVRRDKDGLHIGFFSKNSHRIADCTDCLLQPEEFGKILEIFKKWILKSKISVYSEETGKGLLRHIYLRKAFATGQIMACAVINGDTLPCSRELVDELTRGCKAIASVVLNINKEKSNVILGRECKIIYGSEYIEDILCGLKIRISPLSFYQVNREGAQLLYEKAAELACPAPDDVLLDLYCGAGTIGLSMAGRVRQVIGAEIVPEAVADAEMNAKINGIENARFICADAPKAALELKKEGIKPDIIIIDPPRKGCDPALLETIAALAPGRLIYVSCDPATLARDCATLSTLNYKIQKTTPVDMFPRTGHVETVCLMSRVEGAQHIEADPEFTAAKKKATYENIKAYVLEHSGLKVSNIYIAQVKQKCGIIERKNHSKTKAENTKQPQCPPEKEQAIMEALQHFKMI